MAAASSDSHLQNFGPNSRLNQQQSSKSSCSSFLCKSLIIIVVLVLVPSFPSQAPDFITQSILREFWELFYLLVIGVAVSYGLFCRKSVVAEVEIQSRGSVDAASSHACLSGVFDVPSIFEDGFEKLCVSDEKLSVKNWDFFSSGRKSSSKGSPLIGGGKKFLSLATGNGNDGENDVVAYEAYKENVSQVWNSQFLQGESLVVVANGSCAVDKHKPLGLPIRSLRSRIADSDNREFINSNGAENPSKGSSMSSIASGKLEKIRRPMPLCLEKKFQEVAGPPKSSLQPKSERKEFGEEVSSFGQSFDSRPHYGGNFEMKQFRSKSSRHPKSFGTSSLLPELSNLPKEDSQLKKGLNGFSDTVPPPNVASETVVESFAPKARGVSIGSSSELDMQRTSKDFFNNSSLSAMQDVLDRGKQKSDSMISGSKPSKLSRVLGKGISVRTLRSRVFAADNMKREEVCSDKINEKVEEKHHEFEAPLLMKNAKEGDCKDQPVRVQRPYSEKAPPVQNSTFSASQNYESQNIADSTLLSEKDSESESEPEDLQVTPAEKEIAPNHVEHAELEGSEVDRKADEFIAKFREQMRLQKIASVRRRSSQT
ncbi:OLC1v1038559C1 [Oldenlandia corymbosa var. corymbosa]|uniref:OLC1v1038559C1 n=1 Tax=Oldenlandia corymbosa var. corymbosa TaxID=529605 RepID=A0AAV1D059_OLDCO|nr:OLC1v1038559C1 [Oldenlandia corymbosa var. corymbosa]